jgi:hypothetical protein
MLANRVLGVFLLALAIVIPSCQAVFPMDTVESRPFEPGFLRD